MLTDVGPVEIAVPRDREGSFGPKIVKKRPKRLSGVDEMMISLSAKGLTTGEVQARPAEVHGAEVSRRTVSMITGKVMDGMAERQNRPLDAGRFPSVVATPEKESDLCLEVEPTDCRWRCRRSTSSNVEGISSHPRPQ